MVAATMASRMASEWEQQDSRLNVARDTTGRLSSEDGVGHLSQYSSRCGTLARE